MFTTAHENTCDVLDPLFWTRGATFPLGPIGRHIDHKLASSWILYSIMLILLLCIVCYLRCLRKKKKRKDSFDDQERTLRDSPVTYWSATYGGDDRSQISDSIEPTDFSLYDEPKLHRCKVDRESMIAFLENLPVHDNEADSHTTN